MNLHSIIDVVKAGGNVKYNGTTIGDYEHGLATIYWTPYHADGETMPLGEAARKFLNHIDPIQTIWGKVCS